MSWQDPGPWVIKLLLHDWIFKSISKHLTFIYICTYIYIWCVCVFVCACIIAAYLTSKNIQKATFACKSGGLPQKLHEAPPKPQGGLWRESAGPVTLFGNPQALELLENQGDFPWNHRLTTRNLAFFVATGMLLFYPVASWYIYIYMYIDR